MAWIIVPTRPFERDTNSIRDPMTLDRLQKQIVKISTNPEVGKPLSYVLRGVRVIRVSPFRLLYKIEGNRIMLLRFLHRKEAYR